MRSISVITIFLIRTMSGLGDITRMETKVSGLADVTRMETEMSGLGDITRMETKISGLADVTRMETEMSGLADVTRMETEMSGLADVTRMETEMSGLADVTRMETEMSGLADVTRMETDVTRMGTGTVEDWFSDVRFPGRSTLRTSSSSRKDLINEKSLRRTLSCLQLNRFWFTKKFRICNTVEELFCTGDMQISFSTAFG